MATTYDFTVMRGDTWDGAQFSFEVNGSPLDLTGSSIRWAFAAAAKPSLKVLELSTTGGELSITDAENGEVTALAYQFTSVGTFVHDMQITWPDGTVKTYLSGRLTCTQDVTR